MKRAGRVFIKEKFAGIIWESEGEFGFQYDESYLRDPVYGPVSQTLPLRSIPYLERNMIPFFDGLIPEGWLLNVAIKNWKLNPRDRMGLLLNVCKDCIGAVSINNDKNE